MRPSETKEYQSIKISQFINEFEEFEHVLCERYRNRSHIMPPSDRIALFAVYRGR